jgi:hypothetical protein
MKWSFLSGWEPSGPDFIFVWCCCSVRFQSCPFLCLHKLVVEFKRNVTLFGCYQTSTVFSIYSLKHHLIARSLLLITCSTLVYESKQQNQLSSSYREDIPETLSALYLNVTFRLLFFLSENFYLAVCSQPLSVPFVWSQD